MGRKPQDLTGRRYGRLVAVELLDKSNAYGRWWRCACDCGGTIDAQPYTLNRGSVTSCGCTQSVNRIAALTKHGMTYSQEWNSWCAMRQRCTNPADKDYKKYGGRGIRVCKDWLESFDLFYRDMGPRPVNTTLDRINPNGNYQPSNCRWADSKTQGNNKRRIGLATSDTPGVRWNKSREKWTADHGTKRIGSFNTKEEAVNAKNAYMHSIGVVR